MLLMPKRSDSDVVSYKITVFHLLVRISRLSHFQKDLSLHEDKN
jgi:hypothetical protein